MRDTADSAAAPAARCRNLRRGSFILNLPLAFRSLDHLVGGGEQRGRHSEAERLRHFQIDHQLELGWLQDWQLSRPLALKDRACVDSDLAIDDASIDPIAHQTAGCSKFLLLRPASN